MHVHVPEAGNQEAARSVDDARVSRGSYGGAVPLETEVMRGPSITTVAFGVTEEVLGLMMVTWVMTICGGGAGSSAWAEVLEAGKVESRNARKKDEA